MKSLSILCLLVILAAALKAQPINTPQYKLSDQSETAEENMRKSALGADQYAELLYANDPEKERKTAERKLWYDFRWRVSRFDATDHDEVRFRSKIKLINEHPEWKELIFNCCLLDPFNYNTDPEKRDRAETYINGVELLPYHDLCTWEASRHVYRVLITHYRMARQYFASVDKFMRLSRKKAEEENKSFNDPELSWREKMFQIKLDQLAGVLARFPTSESIEELCLQLESSGSAWTLSAANALSVCTTEDTAPRVRRAFETAKRLRAEYYKYDGAQQTIPLEFQRLERRLADPKADLSAMPEGAGYRFIKPDWNAAKDTSWNQTPPFSTQPRPSVASVQAPMESKSPTWPLWLLLLAPGGWLAGWIMGRRRPAAAS